MKRLTDILSSLAVAILAPALLTVPATLRAQDAGSSTSATTSRSHPSGLTSSSVHVSTSSEIPRVWGGITGSYLPFKVVSATSSSNSTTGESITSTTANGQAGAGLTFNVRLFGPYWLNIGGVYRFGGYDTFDGVNSATIYLERTRARYFDFPVLIRYAGPHFRWNRHSFYEVGGALRYATDIHLTQAASNGFNYYCCAPPSTTSIKRTIEGVVVGTGVSGKDDFGIIVSPEVRYTRWMGDTFRSPTIATMRDQLELTISFGF